MLCCLVGRRFQNHPWNFWGNVFTTRREIAHTPTLMPFTLALKESSLNDSDQVTFHLSCKIRPGPIKLLWAVDASYLLRLINTQSWDVVKELKTEGSSQTGMFYHSADDFHIR